jgi:hypothetical protein
LKDGHEVVLDARTAERASVLGDVASRAPGVVIGDLRSAKETASVAEQVNSVGRPVVGLFAMWIGPPAASTPLALTARVSCTSSLWLWGSHAAGLMY